MPLALLLVPHIHNNTESNKLVIFSGTGFEIMVIYLCNNNVLIRYYIVHKFIAVIIGATTYTCNLGNTNAVYPSQYNLKCFPDNVAQD